MNNTKYTKRLAFRLTEKQYKHLMAEAKRDGIDYSQILRWSLDARYNIGE